MDTSAKLEAVLLWLDSEIAEAREAMEKFEERLNLDPCEAFRWAGSAIAAAAMLDVCLGARSSIKRIDSKVTPDSLCDYALKETVDGATDTSRGSSVTRSELQREIVRAWGRLYAFIRDLP